MKISKMATNIRPSLTRKLFDMAKSYDDVIDFTLGDPDYQTPDHIKDAAINAIQDGKTKYSTNAGILELREVISKRVKHETGHYYDPVSEVMVTVGAMEGIFLSLACLIDPGDEVIIPSPYWINYVHMTEMLSGRPILVETDDENNFVVTPQDVEKAITERTRVMIINSPNNPTGALYDYDTLKCIAEICRIHDITVIFDECYKSILYDDEKFRSILEFEGMKNYAIVINSLSKRYSMTGWRLGYLVGPQVVISNMPKLQENIAACAPLPSQYAAIEALTSDDDDTEKMRRGFENRRNLLVGEINKIEKLSCKKPKGTFYALVNIRKTGMRSEEFAYDLLKNAHVAVVPGVTYGDCCEGYVRMAYTMNEEKILEGVGRVKKYVDYH